VTEVSSDRARHGRPSRWQTPRWPMRHDGAAALRVAGGVAVGVVAVVVAGWSPGVVGVLAGVLTWLLRTAWHALSRRRPN
jgi:hypothetical protein